MQSSVATLPVSSAPARAATKAESLPWFVYAVVLAAACIPIGALWDISWHSTIGRDTFWTPAHIMIYLGGALPGMCCGWIVLKASLILTEHIYPNHMHAATFYLISAATYPFSLALSARASATKWGATTAS